MDAADVDHDKFRHILCRQGTAGPKPCLPDAQDTVDQILNIQVDFLGLLLFVPKEKTSLQGIEPSVSDFQDLLRKTIVDHVSHYASYYTAEDSAIVEWDVFNEVFDYSNRGIINALGEDEGSFDGQNMAADVI